MLVESNQPLTPSSHADNNVTSELKGVTDPPPYTLAALYALSSLPPSTNRLRIHRDQSVNETVVIDTSLPVLPSNKCDKALDVFSKHGNATMCVHLLGQDVKSKAAIVVRSDHGAARLTICERPSTMRVSIQVKSDHGHATVYIPRDFQGPLTTRYKHCSASILPSMALFTRLLEETNGERKYWVGEWAGKSSKKWVGDECVVQSKHSNIKVGFYDRAEEGSELEGAELEDANSVPNGQPA